MLNNKVSRGLGYASKIYALLAIIFVICVAAQVFLAGLAIFVHPDHWLRHTGFVHLFEFIPVLMFILSFIGRMPRWAVGQSAALFGVIFAMYFTANITPVLPWAAALHPVLAIFLFWSSVRLAGTSWKLAFHSQQDKESVYE